MSSIPTNVLENLRGFHDSVTKVDQMLQVYLKLDRAEIEKLPPLDQARFDLMSIFCACSLWWMHLCTQGEDPANNQVLKGEIERVKLYMKRVKEVDDQILRPTIRPDSARKFVRNAIFDPQAPPGHRNREWYDALKAQKNIEEFEEPSTSKNSQNEDNEGPNGKKVKKK